MSLLLMGWCKKGRKPSKKVRQRKGSGSTHFSLIEPASSVGFKCPLDLVPNAAENGHLFVIGSGCMGWVVKAPVIAVKLSGKHRAGLIGVAANGDNRLDLPFQEVVH